MHLELSSQGTLTARPTLSDEVASARRSRPSSWQTLATPKDLLSRARESDPAAVSGLIERYWLATHWYLRRKGAAAQEVADVLQGLFTNLLQRRDIERFEPQGSFRAWLRRCAKNYLCNLRREQQQQALLQAKLAQEGFEQQSLERQSRDPERRLRQERALIDIERGWQHLTAIYDANGERELFDYLRESIYTGCCDRDAELCIELRKSKGYVAERRYRMRHEEYPKSLSAVTGVRAKDIVRRLFDDLA